MKKCDFVQKFDALSELRKDLYHLERTLRCYKQKDCFRAMIEFSSKETGTHSLGFDSHKNALDDAIKKMCRAEIKKINLKINALINSI